MRRVTYLSLAAVLLVGLAACGSKDNGNSSLGTAGTATPTATASGGNTDGPGPTQTTSGNTGGNPTSGNTGNQTPTYPKDANTYGLEILKAWGAKDDARLVVLVETGTFTQIKGYPQPTNTQWTSLLCEATSPDTTRCNYYNAVNIMAVVFMQNAKLGAKNAGSTLYTENLDIPKIPSEYTNRFAYAWSQQNYVGMFVLSNKSVADYFKTKAVLNNWSSDNPVACPGAPTKMCVTLNSGPQNLVPTIRFTVDLPKISAGKPGGITAYQTLT